MKVLVQIRQIDNTLPIGVYQSSATIPTTSCSSSFEIEIEIEGSSIRHIVVNLQRRRLNGRDGRIIWRFREKVLKENGVNIALVSVKVSHCFIE